MRSFSVLSVFHVLATLAALALAATQSKGKDVIKFSGQRVVFYSVDPDINALIGRLNTEVRADLYNATLINGGTTAPNRTIFETNINHLLGPTDFMLFGIRNYDAFMAFYETSPPIMRCYTVGNPIIASSMVVYDPSVPMHVPLNLMVIGGGNETARIEYDLPSSVISLKGAKNKDLYKAATSLDSKLEIMVRKVTGN